MHKLLVIIFFPQSKFYQSFTFVNTAPATFRLTPATHCAPVTEKSQDQRVVIKKLHMTMSKSYSSYIINTLIVLVKSSNQTWDRGIQQLVIY